MIPILWQRVVLTLAIVAAGLLFFHAAGDGSGVAVWSLLADGSVATAVARYALMTIGAVLIASVASALTNPMGGPFVLGAALCFAAVRGGSIDPWLRGIDSTSAYWTLANESLLWLVWITAAASASWWIGERLRSAMPAAWFHGGQESKADSDLYEMTRYFRRRFTGDVKVGRAAIKILNKSTQVVFWRFQTIGAFIVTTIIGMLLTPLLQVNALPGQAVAVLAIVFVIAAMCGYYLFPTAHPLALLASPIVTGGLWYGIIAMAGLSRHTILQQYFQAPIQFYHAGLISPIYFASAGVAGAAMGVTWSAALITDDGQAEAEPASAA